MENLFSILIGILPLLIVLGVLKKMLGIQLAGGKKGSQGGFLNLLLAPVKTVLGSLWRGISRIGGDIHGYLFGRWPGVMTLVYLTLAGGMVLLLLL